jgi:hypothetical protein
MTDYIIPADKAADYVVDESTLEFPCRINDLRDGTVKMMTRNSQTGQIAATNLGGGGSASANSANYGLVILENTDVSINNNYSPIIATIPVEEGELSKRMSVEFSVNHSYYGAFSGTSEVKFNQNDNTVGISGSIGTNGLAAAKVDGNIELRFLSEYQGEVGHTLTSRLEYKVVTDDTVSNEGESSSGSSSNSSSGSSSNSSSSEGSSSSSSNSSSSEGK